MYFVDRMQISVLLSQRPWPKRNGNKSTVLTRTGAQIVLTKVHTRFVYIVTTEMGVFLNWKFNYATNDMRGYIKKSF